MQEVRDEIEAAKDMNAVIISMDFCGFEAKISKCNSKYFNDLVFVLECLQYDQESREYIWHRHYFDTLADSPVGKNDFYFVRQSLQTILPMIERFNGIYLFSDNAGKHFKNRRTMRFMSQFAYMNSFDIHWTMYAPHHGYSLCDAHGGRINASKLKNEKNRHQPQTCQDLKNMIDSQFENTTVHILQRIDKTVFNGLKYRVMQKLHTFDFDTHHNVRCYFDDNDKQRDVLRYRCNYSDDVDPPAVHRSDEDEEEEEENHDHVQPDEEDKMNYDVGDKE